MTKDDSITNGFKLFDKNDKSVRGNVARESLGFGAAEFASMGVSLGVVAFMDKIVPKAIMDKVVHVVAKTVIEPNLDFIERNMKKCRLEECQVDESKTREERSCRLAKGVVVFGSAWSLSYAAKLATRRFANHKFGIEEKKKLPSDTPILKRIMHHTPFGSTAQENMIALADEGVHIGSLVYLNTKASKFTEDHIHKLSDTLEKLGVSPQKAKEVSTMVMVWEVPNVLGTMAGVGTIFGKHAYGFAGKAKCKYQPIGKILDGTAQSLANQR